jgi:cell division protease FtsH
MRLPEGDRISVSREKLMADIAVAMGGRVAEELIFGYDKVTAGASSDIDQATKIARHMVTQWGMSDKLGPVGYAENQQEVFLGAQLHQIKNVSEATAQTIDSEIRKIVETGYQRARELLSEKLDLLHKLAGALLEYETLNGEEIAALMRGDPMPERSGAARPSDTPSPDGASPAGKGGPRRGSVPPTVPDAGGIEPSPSPG